MVYIVLIIFSLNCHSQEVNQANAKLFDAVNKKDLPSLKALVENGVNVNVVNPHGYSPLLIAAKNGDFKIVKLLVKNGADVNLIKGASSTPIFWAIMNRHTEIAKFLINQNADFSFNNIFNPLLAVSFTCNPQLIDFILKKGANVNVVDHMGNNSLAMISFMRQSDYLKIDKADIIKSVSLLLEHNINIKGKSDYKQRLSPMIGLCRKAPLEVIEMVLAHGMEVNPQPGKAKITPLHSAVERLCPNYELVKMLIAKGAKLNAQDYRGRTPLLRAIDHCSNLKEDKLIEQHKIINLLIDSKADINIVDRYDSTTLNYAAEFYPGIFPLLISRGANLNAQDDEGKTTLIKEIAKRDELEGDKVEENYKAVKLIIDNGADLNIADKNGNTAICNAIENCSTDIAELLISKGAKIDTQDTKGKTPLMKAIENCSEFEGEELAEQNKIIKLLVDSGANLSIADKAGKTALDYALENGLDEIEIFLKIKNEERVKQ